MHSNSTRLGGNAVDHIGIVVDDFEKLPAILVDLLGGELGEVVAAPDLGIEVMWVKLGGVALEVIRPVDPEARAAAVLRAGQGGVHHIAVAVEDIDQALAEARERGIEPLDGEPRTGVHGTRIAFLPAESTSGALIELVEAGARRRIL